MSELALGDLVEITEISWALDHNIALHMGKIGRVRSIGDFGIHRDKCGAIHPLISVQFDTSDAENLPDWLCELGFDPALGQKGFHLLVPAYALSLLMKAA